MHPRLWPRALLGCTLLIPVLAACAAPDLMSFSLPPPPGVVAATDCPLTEPEWLTPPEDPAVDGPAAPGLYHVNDDRSIWAGAWWAQAEEYRLRAGKEGIKIGWFRPAGAEMEITGRRLDGEAPPLDGHVVCCYPTRFQAGGLAFPTEGCWEITARAAGSELTFVVSVDP